MSKATPVVLLHDAAIDEFMSTILLTTMDSVDLLAVVVVNGDCIPEPAMDAAWRIQQFIGRTDIPLGLSAARGYNAFPWEYRGDCIKENELTPLAPYTPAPRPFADGDALLRRVLSEATAPVTILCTGPFTPLAMLLDDPDAAKLVANIAGVVWMGGAIDVQGNLDPATLPVGVANPYAEWNVFFDPFAADRVFRETTFPITLFPLDITDTAKVTDAFRDSLLTQGKTSRASFLAWESYEIVANETFYELWDVTATVWLARPDLYDAPKTMTLRVVTDDAALQGALVPDAAGRAVEVVMAFADQAGFYDYVLAQFATA